MTARIIDLRAHLEANVMPIPFAGCLIWMGGLTSAGYGRFMTNYREVLTHIVAWELEHGPVPEGLELDHLCRVRSCCRTAHLEPVTHRVNLLRGAGMAAVNARKTHCDWGHELTGPSVRVTAAGARVCRVCVTEKMRAWRLANPEEARALNKRSNDARRARQ